MKDLAIALDDRPGTSRVNSVFSLGGWPRRVSTSKSFTATTTIN